jgi:uncharacterized tellurite resistance protein B-like protein
MKNDNLHALLERLFDVVESHDYYSLDCNMSGKIYCNCLENARNMVRSLDQNKRFAALKHLFGVVDAHDCERLGECENGTDYCCCFKDAKNNIRNFLFLKNL